MPINFCSEESPFAGLHALTQRAISKPLQIVNSQVVLSIEQIYSDLLELAEQSIFAPQEKLVEYKSQYLSLIYRLYFDPIDGGLVLPLYKSNSNESHDYYQKPILINIMLADFLLTSDQFLYTGKLTQIGKSSVSYLVSQLELSNNHYFEKQTYSDLAGINCCFDPAIIQQALDQTEINLLEALTSRHESDRLTNKTKNLFCYFNHRSLVEAAESISMPVKQAQIIEHAIQVKLKNLPPNQSQKKLKIDNPLITNCAMMKTLTRALLFEQENSWQQSANLLMDSLLQQLNQESIASYHRINLVVAGFHFLQTNFNEQLAKRLLSELHQIDFEQLPSPPSEQTQLINIHQSLELLAGIVAKFNQCAWLEINDLRLENSLSTYLGDRWKIEILRQTDVQLDRKLVQIKSEFNPYRMIFCI